jgi:hypothetical protein
MRDPIDMAREAELNVGPAGMGQTVWGSDTNLKRFEALVRADERESCAKVCDRMAARCNDIRAAALESAAENVRARGNT